jgi:ssRNA-specific RNase YbeY (16S rRNA maturation enzyme)
MFTFKYFHIPRTLSRSYCTRALQVLEKVIKKPQKGIIHLIVLDSEEMARMNQQFRGKEGPTDILTFSFREGGKRQKVKGKRGGLVILPPEKGGQGGLDSTSLPPMAGLAGMTETVA